MLHTLKGQQLTIQVESKGAELKSMKDNDNDREYMWSSDAKYWGKISPILFPFVGASKNGAYSYGGKTYEMSRHGFARDMEFELTEQTENTLVFALEDCETTRENYPFLFRLEIEYQIEGKSLWVRWRVFNKDTKEMYFSIGGHPAFACPPSKGIDLDVSSKARKRTDCYIKFDGAEEIKISGIDMASGLATGESVTYKTEEGLLPISENLFDKDALVIENSQCHKVSLCDEHKKPYITVTFDAPLFGVWSVPDSQAAYVCIEPWYGRCDSTDFVGELQEKDWINSLVPGEAFEKEYEIKIEE